MNAREELDDADDAPPGEVAPGGAVIQRKTKTWPFECRLCGAMAESSTAALPRKQQVCLMCSAVADSVDEWDEEEAMEDLSDGVGHLSLRGDEDLLSEGLGNLSMDDAASGSSSPWRHPRRRHSAVAANASERHSAVAEDAGGRGVRGGGGEGGGRGGHGEHERRGSSRQRVQGQQSRRAVYLTARSRSRGRSSGDHHSGDDERDDYEQDHCEKDTYAPKGSGELNNTLNFMFAQFCLCYQAKEADFRNLMDRTPASIVMVLCEESVHDLVIEGKTQRQHFIDKYLKENQGKWGALRHFEGSGAIFWKLGRSISNVVDIGPRQTPSAVAEIAAPAHVGPRSAGGEVAVLHWAYVAYNVEFTSSYFNPKCNLVISAVIRPHFASPLEWGPQFLQYLQDRLVADEARFLCGIFHNQTWEVEGVCRSCGACTSRPFHVAFKSKVADREVTHPVYIIPFGYCKTTKTPTEARSEPPDWMEGSFFMDVDKLPKLHPFGDDKLDPVFPQDLPNLGKVKQKHMNLEKWDVPFIHQLLLWIGTARQGMEARGKHRRKKKQRQSWWKQKRKRTPRPVRSSGHSSGVSW